MRTRSALFRESPRRIPAPVAGLLTVLAVACWTTPSFAQDAAPPAKDVEFFERHIRPVLVERCYKCHSSSAKDLKGGLRLDSRQGWTKGGASGAVIVPGDPDESLLVSALRYELLEMPPDGPLSDERIRNFEQWIRSGAADPRDEPPTAPGPPLSPPHWGGSRRGDWEAARQFWSLAPIRKPPLPEVADADWPITPVDFFVLAKMTEHGFSPAPPTDRRTLIRRVTFDLTGLPPAPEEIDAFLADNSPGAYESLVERLLASPHYGERWGRHWLDVVRYADTSGCNGDFPLPDAYRYRNYVIDSFNRDKPYDQFLREQIAGDLLPAKSDAQRYEHAIATGYLAISRRFSSLNEEFHLTIDDTIDNLGKAVLGLSLACARCHDHKFDPVPQHDYYALYGIFQSTRYAFPGTEIYRHTNGLTPLVPEEKRKADIGPWLERMDELDAKILATYLTMAELDAGPEKDAKRKEWKAFEAQRDELVKSQPQFPRAFGVSEGTPQNAYIHLKGDPKTPGSEVPRGFLQVLGGQPVPHHEAGSGRRQLAEWLAAPDNPLTARVMVNRIWLHHFGRGIVETPDDFGRRGAAPSHPELLDYLAASFIESGWSVKAMHRLMVLSRAYRMQSAETPESLARDPQNQWLSQFARRRLDAEEIRDALLAVAGTLERSRGGPHPFAPEIEWRYTQHKPFVDDFATLQRSVYLMQQRIRLQPLLAVFDGADTNTATGLRKVSTTPLQALFAMNNPLAHEQAEAFAERVLADRQDPAERIGRAYTLAFGRPPDDEETRTGIEYLADCENELRGAGVDADACAKAAWSSYLRVLMSTGEFLFVD